MCPRPTRQFRLLVPEFSDGQRIALLILAIQTAVSVLSALSRERCTEYDVKRDPTRKDREFFKTSQNILSCSSAEALWDSSFSIDVSDIKVCVRSAR
jgi:hypothetical protein